MGTSKSNTGGTGGAWTGFKRNATLFAKHGGRERAAKALAGYVAAMGGAAAAVAAAGAGARTGQSLGTFLVSSTGPTGVAGGLEAVGLGRLVGTDRFTVLSELVNEFAGAGSDLEAQAARNAVLDVLDQILPDDDTPLEDARLDEAAITDALCRYVAALVYNLAIPVIDERLTQLQDQPLAQQRDQELRDYIDALVRLRMRDRSPMAIDWQGPQGHEFVQAILRAVYEQIEEWE
jgi:molybdopterin converting factor small subunit